MSSTRRDRSISSSKMRRYMITLGVSHYKKKYNFVIGKNEILAKNYKTRVAHFIKEVISSDFTYAFYRCLTNQLLKMTITMPIRV